MDNKNALILETHNWYDWRTYNDILNHVVGPERYIVTTYSRRFTSHANEQDSRTYWIFKAMITKEEENIIRRLIKSSKAPNWTIQEAM